MSIISGEISNVEMVGRSREDGMDKAAADRIEDQLRSVFPEGAITRVQMLQYGDDLEVEPGQAAARVYFDWAGRLDGKQASPRTVHAFAVANSAALDRLSAELPRLIAWVEFRPDHLPGAASLEGLAYRIVRRGGRPALLDEESEEPTPVMTRLGPAELATLDTVIAAGAANSRAEAIRWALARIREHPEYAQLQQRVHEIND
jgi:hypothetical protein